MDLVVEGAGACKVVSVKDGLAAVEWGEVPTPGITPFQQRARRNVHQALAKLGIPAVGPQITLYRAPKGGMFQTAAGVMVGRLFSPVGKVGIQAFPPGRAAHLRVEGPHDRLATAWEMLTIWVEREGLEPTGLNWEEYGGDPGALVTDIYIQIR